SNGLGTLQWLALTDSRLLLTANLAGRTFTADTATGSPVSTSNRGLYDMIEFVDNSSVTHLIITGKDDSSVMITEYNLGVGSWTTNWLSIPANVDRPLGQLSNILLIGTAYNNNTTVDGNLNVTVNRLQLGPNFILTGIYTSIDRAWIMGRAVDQNSVLTGAGYLYH